MQTMWYFVILEVVVTWLMTLTVTNGYSVPPEVEINLDLSPNKRFVSAVDTVLNKHGWEYTFFPIFNESNQSLFNNIPQSDFEIFSSLIKTNWPENYEELQGISDTFITNGYYVSVDYLSAWVYFHELGHAIFNETNITSNHNINNYYNKHKDCTGILVIDSDNKIWHGRNMDQSYSNARNITLKLRFTQNGKTLFEALDWYWFNTGIMTAYKHNVVSLEENWRFEDIGYSNMLSMIKENRIPQVFVFRTALIEYGISYNTILNYILNIPLSSPMYVIIGGTSGKTQGGIITRACQPYTKILGKLNYMNFDNITYDNNDDKYPNWWLVQTNYDHWNLDPINDDRRTIAQNLLLYWNQTEDANSQTLGANLMAVLSTYSVENKNTLYTAIMSPSRGVFLTYVREGLDS